MDRQAWDDLMRFRVAARKVRALAEAESRAFHAFDQAPGPDTSAALQQAHHDELGAIQQMIACLDLLERRNAAMRVAPEGAARTTENSTQDAADRSRTR